MNTPAKIIRMKKTASTIHWLKGPGSDGSGIQSSEGKAEGLVETMQASVKARLASIREYGLPAIANTRVATKQIKTGDKIHVVANTGIVTLL
jgi:hypothetical protein